MESSQRQAAKLTAMRASGESSRRDRANPPRTTLPFFGWRFCLPWRLFGPTRLFPKFKITALLAVLCWPAAIPAQRSYFSGALGGISTLSADGGSAITSPARSISQYKPENGPTFRVFAGRHLGEYFSVEGNYGWNRNRLTLTSAAGDAFYEQARRATQHSLLGELLLYFRNRDSFARPYLSVGAGVVHFTSGEGSIATTVGALEPAPGAFRSTKPALRVAVGIDILFGGGWAFRFSFSETIRKNPISPQLTPPGTRNLAHFQNLFGFVKYF